MSGESTLDPAAATPPSPTILRTLTPVFLYTIGGADIILEARMNIDPAIRLGLRPRMISVAYRMFGSVTDAEDAVQDAFVRLQAAEAVSSPEGFLIRATTRLCIDRLRAARRRKEYVGPWVPEPVDTKDGARGSALAESLAQAFLLMLERLSPDERAAFLLRRVFDYGYAEIAEVLG